MEVDSIRLADEQIPPGVTTDLGPDVGAGDGWPTIHDRILNAVVIFASPT